MRRLLTTLSVIALWAAPAASAGQDDEGSASRLSEERLERARQDYFRMKAGDVRSPDLWYAAPGIRPGGDLLGPVIDLVRKPSGLLDFRPRPIQPYLPDPETAEFLRERR